MATFLLVRFSTVFWCAALVFGAFVTAEIDETRLSSGSAGTVENYDLPQVVESVVSSISTTELVPEQTAAPACSVCFEVQGYETFSADPVIIGTITETLIATTLTNDGIVLATTFTKWSNTTAVVSPPSPTPGPNLLEQMESNTVLVEDGTYRFSDFVFTVGLNYTIATTEPWADVFEPSDSGCQSTRVSRGLSLVYEESPVGVQKLENAVDRALLLLSRSELTRDLHTCSASPERFGSDGQSSSSAFSQLDSRNFRLFRPVEAFHLVKRFINGGGGRRGGRGGRGRGRGRGGRG